MAKEAKSVIELIRELDEQRSSLLEGAKTEALAAAEKAIADLSALGFHYSLVEGDEPQRRSEPKANGAGKKGPRTLNSNRTCPICELVTIPPHDARKHRGQGENKRPFSDEELAALEMRKA